MRVVGIGCLDRGDDAAGRLAARRAGALLGEAVAVVETEGGLTELLEAWRGARAVIVADVVRSGLPPGTLLRLDSRREPLPPRAEGSTHGLGLLEAIELGRTLERLPETLVIHGIEGLSFGTGAAPSPPVEAGLERLAARIAAEARRLLGGDAAAPARAGPARRERAASGPRTAAPGHALHPGTSPRSGGVDSRKGSRRTNSGREKPSG